MVSILESFGTISTLVVGVAEGGLRGTSDFDTILRDVSARHGARYLPSPIRSVDTHDGVHLNQEGAQRWHMTVRRQLCEYTGNLATRP